MSEDYLKTLMTTRNRQRGTGGERARHLIPSVPFRSSFRLLSLTDSLVGSFKQSAKTDSFDAIRMLIISHLALTWRGGGLRYTLRESYTRLAHVCVRPPRQSMQVLHPALARHTYPSGDRPCRPGNAFSLPRRSHSAMPSGHFTHGFSMFSV